MSYEDLLSSNREQKKTVNAQSVVDIRLLASIHKSMRMLNEETGQNASEFIRKALEAYFIDLRTRGRLRPITKVGEAIAYLRSMGISFRELSGTRTRYTKSSLVEALAYEEYEKNAEDRYVPVQEHSTTPIQETEKRPPILEDFPDVAERFEEYEREQQRKALEYDTSKDVEKIFGVESIDDLYTEAAKAQEKDKRE